MAKSRRTILIVLNLLAVIFVLLTIGWFTINPGNVPLTASHEQLAAKIEHISDSARLCAIIVRDDEYIRALEFLVGHLNAETRIVLILLGVFAALTLLLLVAPQSSASRDRAASKT